MTNTDQGRLKHKISGEEAKEGVSMMNTDKRQGKYTLPGYEERKGVCEYSEHR